MQGDAVMGQFDDSVGAFVRLDAGVSSLAGDGEPEVAAALAGRDDVAVFTPGLEHQREIMVRCQVGKTLPRDAHVGLFVAAADQRYCCERVECTEVL